MTHTMRNELLGQEKNIVRIKLEIEAEEFRKALNKTLNELSQQVNIPGFRKGKVNRGVLEMRFGREAIYNEALEKIMPDAIKHIVEDYDLDLIETPAVELSEPLAEGKPVNCEIKFEVRPEIELPEIDGLEIEKVVSEVDDEAVDRFAKRIRIQLASIQPVERAVQDGDIVDIELTVRTLNDDGTESSEQPKPDTTHEKINLADETIRKQVREALIGKSKGEDVTAEFDVEAGHSEMSLAGKHVRYKMIIENVSEYVLPELSEQFYKDVFGENTDIKDEEAFRARLRSDLTRQVAEESLNDLRNRAVELVASKSKLEIPESLIERQKDTMRKEDEGWAKNNGIELKEAYGLDTEEGRKGYENLLKTRAEATVRSVLVMDELAKKLDVHVEESDLDAEFERRAGQMNVSKGFVAKYFHENKNSLDRLVDEVRWDKVIDAAISHMNVKEVKELSQPSEEQKNEGE